MELTIDQIVERAKNLITTIQQGQQRLDGLNAAVAQTRDVMVRADAQLAMLKELAGEGAWSDIEAMLKGDTSGHSATQG